MTDLHNEDHPEEQHSPANAGEKLDDGCLPVDDALINAKDAIEKALDPVSAQREEKLRMLSDWREAEGNSSFDFDLNYIFQLNQAELPLTQKDMLHETGKQALVLTRDDLDILDRLVFINVSGEMVVIKPENVDPNDVFILYPDEVGNEELKAE